MSWLSVSGSRCHSAKAKLSFALVSLDSHTYRAGSSIAFRDGLGEYLKEVHYFGKDVFQRRQVGRNPFYSYAESILVNVCSIDCFQPSGDDNLVNNKTSQVKAVRRRNGHETKRQRRDEDS